MKLPLKIAKRYLFSSKNHSVINILSVVSAVAIGVGCAALIIILSVFNGFNSLVTKIYSSGAPDFVVEPTMGKVLSLNDSSVVNLMSFKEEFSFVPVAEEKAYLQYGGNQMIGTIVGKRLESNIVVSETVFVSNLTPHDNTTDTLTPFSTDSGSPYAIVGEVAAQHLGIQEPLYLDSITIYMPTRTGDISLIMPMESVWSETLPILKIYHEGESQSPRIGETEQVFIPLEVAQDLLEYSEEEVNRLELFAKNHHITKKMKRELEKVLGSQYAIKDFNGQNATVFKMIRSEKLAVYLILFFVIIIIGVNILSTVAIMIINKRDDIQTFRTMGSGGSLLRRAFTLHGALICMTGALAGLVMGLIVCYLQQQFELVALPGNFMTEAYPISVKLSDVLIILFGIFTICFCLSYIPSRIVR